MIKIDLPTYKVKTPQTLAEFEVESLVIADENKLKTSITDNLGLTKILNQILFNKCKIKPDNIKTYDDFLNNVTLNDRQALIAGLYHISYGNEYIVEDICPACRTLNESKVSIENIGQVTFYEGSPFEILQTEVEVELTPSIKAYLKPPTLQEEIQYFDILSLNDPIFSYTLFLPVKKIVTNDGTFTQKDNTYDLLAFLQSLPVKYRKKLSHEYYERINKYTIQLPYKVRCKKCGNDFVSSINFLEELFRMALEVE